MSWQHWDTPAIIIPAPVQAEIQIVQKQQQQISVQQHFRQVYDQPWNSLQADGRINMGGAKSASISPYSQHYRSQIEDGIWPLVNVLYTRGYLTVSSCAGHRGSLVQELDVLYVYRSSPYVSIAVHRDLETVTVAELHKRLHKHTHITVKHTQANMDATSTRPQHKRTAPDRSQEYDALNWMLQRNYTEWSYVNIVINPWKKYSIPHLLRTQREHTLILELADCLQDLPHYSL